MSSSEKQPLVSSITVSHRCISRIFPRLLCNVVGQTPRKLFNTPHPDRMMHGSSSLPIGSIYGIPEDYHLLSQSGKVIRGEFFAYRCVDHADKQSLQDLGAAYPVSELVVDLIGERIIPCAERTLAVPSHPHEVIEWDPAHAPAGELRVVVDRKVCILSFSSCLRILSHSSTPD